MKAQPGEQRSFRISPRTLELLDVAAATGESRNALVDRLLGEAVRTEHHPLIRFCAGAAGRRQPLLTGTRLAVHQIVSTLRASDGDTEAAADYLGLAPRQVRAAVEYYAEFCRRDRRRRRRGRASPAGREGPVGAPAACAGVRLALDNHYSTEIAVRLRENDHDVVAAVEKGWEREDDESLLAICVNERRALLTNDVADFAAVARRWAVEGRRHPGLIFTSDSNMPRARRTIGRYVDALDALVRAHPSHDAFAERVHWLVVARESLATRSTRGRTSTAAGGSPGVPGSHRGSSLSM